MSMARVFTPDALSLLGKLRLRLSTLWPNRALLLALPLSGGGSGYRLQV